jgi:uncharacterized protein
MRLNEVRYDTGTPITGYGPGFFRVGEAVIEGAALVLPGAAGPWGGYDDTGSLLAVADRIDVLFVGTGAEIAHCPPGFRAPLEGAGIGVEVMASPAACRTYNVLLGEGRRVAVALLPVGA